MDEEWANVNLCLTPVSVREHQRTAVEESKESKEALLLFRLLTRHCLLQNPRIETIVNRIVPNVHHPAEAFLFNNINSLLSSIVLIL
jgi:hypothetical protein